MNKFIKISFSLIFLLNTFFFFAQEVESESSNIQTYTPSKLLEKGKWDIKWFNNLYTQTKKDDNGKTLELPRENFFTTSLEIFTGVSENKKFNAGLIIEYRSNSFGGESATSVFSPSNEIGKSRTGLSHIAPSVKIAPFASLPRFSMQSSFFIPILKEESNQYGFLSENSFIWQNRFFYDHTFTGNKFQLFSELSTRFFFGDKEKGYANNSFELAPGVFLSYFPTSKFTILTFTQHSQLIEISNNYSRNFTAIGLGSKYQLTNEINIEILYSNFVRGNDTGLGQSFNLGLRAIF
jgi:hypothetical protein